MTRFGSEITVLVLAGSIVAGSVTRAEQTAMQLPPIPELNEQMCADARASAYDAVAALASRPSLIIAIGSSSTEGIARNNKNRLYPAVMQAALQKIWPEADMRVLNKGKGGETMSQTLERFDTDVIALKPSLVVWQLGVNDVLRHDGVEGRRDEIQAGLRRLGDAGIPVILLDLQYAPVVLRDPDALPMQELIQAEAKAGPHGRVFHFRRFALMKQLAEQGRISSAQMTEGDGLHMTDQMHTCIGSLLADMVAGATRSASASTSKN